MGRVTEDGRVLDGYRSPFSHSSSSSEALSRLTSENTRFSPSKLISLFSVCTCTCTCTVCEITHSFLSDNTKLTNQLHVHVHVYVADLSTHHICIFTFSSIVCTLYRAYNMIKNNFF